MSQAGERGTPAPGSPRGNRSFRVVAIVVGIIAGTWLVVEILDVPFKPGVRYTINLATSVALFLLCYMALKRFAKWVARRIGASCKNDGSSEQDTNEASQSDLGEQPGEQDVRS